MRDGLRGSRPLAIGCANDTGNDMTFVDCGERHTAEFAGIFTITPPGRPFPGEAAVSDLARDGCGKLAASYLGVSRGVSHELIWIPWGRYTRESWEFGDQSFRCYVAVADRDRPIRGGATLKNLGDKSVPH